MTEYQIHAIRYATDPDRCRRQNFDDTDSEPSRLMPMDYFVWAIVGERTFIVDTGFDRSVATQRGRTLLRPVDEGLGLLGIETASVEDVILTHLHHDHAGNRAIFGHACHHMQEAEMHFCTGACMLDPASGAAYDARDVAHLVGSVFTGKVAFHKGASEIADGISLHLLGGHTGGLQAVRVRTARGYVVLASDAMHYYEHMHSGRVFPVHADRSAVLSGYGTLEELAASSDHIIPGHDPAVLRGYPPSVRGIDDIVRLDLTPYWS